MAVSPGRQCLSGSRWTTERPTLPIPLQHGPSEGHTLRPFAQIPGSGQEPPPRAEPRTPPGHPPGEGRYLGDHVLAGQQQGAQQVLPAVVPQGVDGHLREGPRGGEGLRPRSPGPRRAGSTGSGGRAAWSRASERPRLRSRPHGPGQPARPGPGPPVQEAGLSPPGEEGSVGLLPHSRPLLPHCSTQVLGGQGQPKGDALGHRSPVSPGGGGGETQCSAPPPRPGR